MWADKQISLPYSTQEPEFQLDRAPWLKPAFEALGNHVYKKIDVRGPAGSGKSLIGELDIAFSIDNDPGLYYYVWPGDQDAKDQVEDRIVPLINANEILAKRMPGDRNKKRNTKILFPDMSFYSVGANESNAQRVRAYRLTMEEPHMFKEGMLTKMRKRMRGVIGARELTLSTGSVVDDQSDKEFIQGSTHEWQVPCPHCGKFQPFTTAQLKWDKNSETVDVEQNYRWDALRATVRYECVFCNGHFPKDQKGRLAQARLGKAVETNPNASKHNFSYHYHALAVDWISMEDIAEEYILAVYASRSGSLELLKDFTQKTEANAWDESPPKNKDEVKERFGGYVKKSEWSEEICRFLTVDNQHGKSSKGEMPHRWCLVRAYSLSESRLIDECRVDTWDDVESLRKELDVPQKRTLIDIAFDRTDVLKACYQFGWQGLIGEDKRQAFPHHGKDENGNPAIYQLPYSPPRFGHVGIGQKGRLTSATYFHWCHKPIKDLYHRLSGGLAEDYNFTIADDVTDDYMKHVIVEIKKMVKGKWEWWKPSNKDDHLLDCEQMNLAAAIMDPHLPLGKSLKIKVKETQNAES